MKSTKSAKPRPMNRRAEDAALADKIARTKAREPLIDPTGKWHEQCRALADEFRVPVGDILDEWHHRAAIIFYDGQIAWDEAERRAFVDTEMRYVRQGRLAI